MADKKALLEASDDGDTLLSIIQRHNNRKDAFDLNVTLAGLDDGEMDKLWANIYDITSESLLSIESQEMRCYAILRAVITLGSEVIRQTEPHVPQPFLLTATLLHGILPSLPEEEDKLKNAISRLCEAWWKNDLLSRHELGTYTLMYLVECSLGDRATVSDLKRVLALHEILPQVDFSDADNQELKTLLEAAVFNVHYLKHDDGRKFLSHALNISPAITKDLHAVIKNQLPYVPRSVLPSYGEVYYRAWKLAIGENLQRLEDCIQGLMYDSLLVKASLASSIRKVLSYIHQQKIERGVDAMLVRLYQPILWRHLKVANGDVRYNAASLLVSAFPLLDPDLSVKERDEMLQQQFDALKTLLFDPDHRVRVVVIVGVCNIVADFWALIPGAVIKDLLGSIVNDLAHDSADPEVRTAVYRGLTNLLNNPLTHPMLKTLLPQMGSNFHDVSEKVRVAFADMLLKLKGFKTIRFWDVVPLEHLYTRLELDDGPVARRLVKLLLNSYFPDTDDTDLLLTRCVHLIEHNKAAARRFYQHVQPHASLGKLARFIGAIFNLLNHDLLIQLRDKSSTSFSGGDSSAVEHDLLESFGEGDKEKTAAPADTSSTGTLIVDDDETVASLVEVVVIIWTTIYHKLLPNHCAELRQNLEKSAGETLAGLVRAYNNARISEAAVMLAGYIPANLVPTISVGMLSRLKKLPDSATSAQYGHLLEALCKWGRASDTLQLVQSWVTGALAETESETEEEPRAKVRGVTFAPDPVTPRPDLALQLLGHLLRHYVCREILLKQHKGALRETADTLKTVMRTIERRLRSPEAVSELATDAMLKDALEAYLTIEVLLYDKEDASRPTVTVLESLISWADVELMPCLRRPTSARGGAHKKGRRLLGHSDMTLLSEPGAEGATASGTMLQTMSGGSDTLCGDLTLSQTLSTTLAAKRSAGGDTAGNKELCVAVLQVVLGVAADLCMCGISDQELASHLCDFSLQLLDMDDARSTQLLPSICKLMYQVTELTLAYGNHGDTADEGVGSRGGLDLVPRMLQKGVTMVVALATHKPELSQRILPLVKPALTEMLVAYYRHHTLYNTTPQHDVMATVVRGVVNNMAATVTKDESYEACSAPKDLPALPAFFMTCLWKRANLVGAFLSALSASVATADDGQTHKPEELLGAIHLLHTVLHDKRKYAEAKDTVTALEAATARCDQEYASTHEKLLAGCQTLLQDCKNRV